MLITTVRKALVAASATAISATGLLIGPAPAQALPISPLTPPPKPPPCDQYGFPGDVTLRDDRGNGLVINTSFSSTGPTASGPATSKGTDGLISVGTISGEITGRHIDLTYTQDASGASFRFIGDVGDDVKGHGTYAGGFWNTVFPLSCISAPPPKPEEQEPPANPGAPSKTAFVTTPEDYNTVDVYDVPGGEGNVIGVVAKDKGVQVNADCKPDDWCLVRGAAVPDGQGWIWGHLRFE
jgi:hypothetical protein